MAATGGAAMQEKSGRDQGSHFTAFRERAEIPDEHAEGITVERRGNPEVLNVVCDDPAVVLGGGEVLFKEGDAADGMYIVKSGTLRIRSGSVVYEDAVAGGVVGEMAIVEDELPRSAMVYALGRSEVVKISEKRFFDLGEAGICPDRHAGAVPPTASHGSTLSAGAADGAYPRFLSGSAGIARSFLETCDRCDEGYSQYRINLPAVKVGRPVGSFFSCGRRHMMVDSVPGQKGLSDAELRVVAEVAVEMARTATEPFNAHAAALTFARAALKDSNAKQALAAMHRNISTRRAIDPHFSLGAVSTAALEPDATDIEGPSTVSSGSPANELNPAEGPTLESADARPNDNQAVRQALAASLAEIIDDVLRTRQFAVRAVF